MRWLQDSPFSYSQTALVVAYFNPSQNCHMEWWAALASILGTSGVTAIIAAITAPRSEARRLRADIAANSLAGEKLLSGSNQAITRAMNADGFRLASLTLVRFERWLSVASGLVAILIVAVAGVILAYNAGPLSKQVTTSFAKHPVSSALVTVGVLLSGIAIGWAVGFVRSSMLRSARTAFVREELRALDGSTDPSELTFGPMIAFWKRFHSRGTEILFTRD